MNHRGQYSKSTTVSKVLWIILVAVAVFAVYAISTANAAKDWDVEYPMTNVNVTWLQSFHSGGWEV